MQSHGVKGPLGMIPAPWPETIPYRSLVRLDVSGSMDLHSGHKPHFLMAALAEEETVATIGMIFRFWH